MLPPTLGIAVHLFDRMAFGGQWQYNVPSQWLVDADDDDKDADGRNLIEGCDADHGQDMGDYGLLLQMKNECCHDGHHAGYSDQDDDGDMTTQVHDRYRMGLGQGVVSAPRI